MKPRISSRYHNSDCYRSATSLGSELELVDTLLKISKRCLCPRLKTHAEELHARKVTLKGELKIRPEREKVPHKDRKIKAVMS